MNLLIQYITYRIKAKGRHGTHSPFIYSFINNCLTTKIDKKFLSQRKKLFKTLKKDPTIIKIKDFGAGSKSLGDSRKISKIFSTSSSKGKFSLLLYRLSKHYTLKNTLELGTSLGIGTIHLSQGNPEGKVTTIEACPNTYSYAQNNFNQLSTTNILSILSTFDDFLNTYSGEKFDLVFIDGHHEGNALINYLEKLKVHTHNDTIFILDDIRWSKSMLESWDKIILNPSYNVTIDLFRMGIIIPRNQQKKEHFLIKF